MSASTDKTSLTGSAKAYARFLEEMNLSPAQLDKQDLNQLYASLERVNALISTPDSMPRVKTTVLFIDLDVGPLPVLFRIKDHILQRIATLGGDELTSSLRARVAGVGDPTVRNELDTEIDRLEERGRQLEWERQRLSQERDLQQQKLQSDFESAVERQKFEQEQARSAARARVWQRFFARESVATLIGAVILLTLTVCIIVAMFTATEVSAVLSNSFLLILGYFFGQTTGQAIARVESDRNTSEGERIGPPASSAAG